MWGASRRSFEFLLRWGELRLGVTCKAVEAEYDQCLKWSGTVNCRKRRRGGWSVATRMVTDDLGLGRGTVTESPTHTLNDTNPVAITKRRGGSSSLQTYPTKKRSSLVLLQRRAQTTSHK